MDQTWKKMLQKRFYDLLSHKYGILMLIAGAFLIMLSAFHFGQAWLEWSQEKYEAVFNSFSDNIAGKSFKDRLSVPLPIDVVYTWVNGTDPELIRQLELVKVSMDRKSNLSRKQEMSKREEHCTYTNCFCVGLLLDPPLKKETTLNDIIEADGILGNVTDLKEIRENKEGPANFTLLSLENENDVKKILKSKTSGWTFRGTNHTFKPAYYTSEGSLPHGLVLPELVMMSGFPSHYGDENIRQSVAGRLNITDKLSVGVKLYTDKGLALLQIKQKPHYDSLIKSKNFTIDSKELRLSPVKLVWDLKFVVTDDVIAASRFEDNEELRYSLRSVETFAPWVRHIYIVTNGQIPYWLNLDNPRLTIVTHDEIFMNASHLPTFSSPAIEANVHRIPGLSDKFLYLNDDVMFGRPVWPDDFYTHSAGQKLYLTWPVPNCNEGCPTTWIRDGYCDKACNSSECDWDGGDCIGSKGNVQLGAGFHGDHGHLLSDYVSYCSTGCANNWLADKYCDQACNKLECGFDVGDCGTDNYGKLYDLKLKLGKTHYILPPGEMIGYFNLSELVGVNGKMKSARYETNTAMRTAAVANKFKVMTMVLNKGVNATTLKFYLDFTRDGNDTEKVNLTVQVDTSVVKPTVEVIKVKNETTSAAGFNTDDQLDAAAFEDVQIHHRGPLVPTLQKTADTEAEPLPEGIDTDILEVFQRVNMSDVLRQWLLKLHYAYKEEEFTAQGMKVKLLELVKHFGQELMSLKPRFLEEKQKLAEEIKLREQNKTLENVNNATNSAYKQQKNVNSLQGEGRPNNRISKRVGLNGSDPQQIVMQDLQMLQHQRQEQQAEGPLNPGQFAKRDILPQSDLYHAETPGNMPMESPHLKRQSGLLFQQDQNQQQKRRSQQRSSESAGKQNIVGNHGQIIPPVLKNFESEDKSRSIFGQAVGDVETWNKSELHKQPAAMDSFAGTDGNVYDGRQRKLLGVLRWSDHSARLEEQHDRARSMMREDKLEDEMSDDEFLRLVNVDGAEEYVGGLPWEKKIWQNKEKDSRERGRKANDYVIEGWQGRQLLDTFGDSLRHVNRIYNKEFGIASRKVPGHMPHMIDKNIMQELQDRFPMEWDETSSHKIRSSTDMQYAFAYYYYLMGVTVEVTVEEVFDTMDTDHSGVLSDREIRTLAARMYDLPLYLETLTGLEAMLVNCSHGVNDPSLMSLTESQQEVYYDKSMPQVTRYFFIHCEELAKHVKEKFKPVLKYKTTIVDDADIAFKMIHTNVSHVVGQLDDVRKHPKKFICLNDNIDHRKEEAKTVKAILQDFYESLVPTPSQFELPRDYRNRFLHMDELREWRVYRDRLRLWTHVALIVLVLLTIVSFLGDKIENLRRKWTNHKRRQRQSSTSSDAEPSGFVSVTPPTTRPCEGSVSSSARRWQDIVETV